MIPKWLSNFFRISPSVWLNYQMNQFLTPASVCCCAIFTSLCVYAKCLIKLPSESICFVIPKWLSNLFWLWLLVLIYIDKFIMTYSPYQFGNGLECNIRGTMNMMSAEPFFAMPIVKHCFARDKAKLLWWIPTLHTEGRQWIWMNKSILIEDCLSGFVSL